jgi:hypothetical protein
MCYGYSADLEILRGANLCRRSAVSPESPAGFPPLELTGIQEVLIANLNGGKGRLAGPACSNLFSVGPTFPQIGVLRLIPQGIIIEIARLMDYPGPDCCTRGLADAEC